jgi:hypothetical protein
MRISDGADLIVRQANDLIESMYRLPTISEERIIRLLISQIKPNDEDFKTYRISVADFAKVFGIEETSGRLYEQIDRATEALTTRKLNIRMGKSYLHVNWLSSALYKDGSGYVDLRFDPYLKPFLLHLNGYYTKYHLTNITQFQSRYSIRIYEFLKMETFKTPKFGLFTKLVEYSELRAMLGVEEHEYKFVKDFRKYVIEVAVREINSRSDIFVVKVLPIKSGKKISYWEFHFENARQSRMPVDPPPPTLEEVKEHPEYIRQLIDFGISEETALKWKKKYGVERLVRNIGFVSAKKNTGKVRDNLAGYVASAIAEDMAKGASLSKKVESEKQLEEINIKAQKNAEIESQIQELEAEKRNIIGKVYAVYDALEEVPKNIFNMGFSSQSNLLGAIKKGFEKDGIKSLIAISSIIRYMEDCKMFEAGTHQRYSAINAQQAELETKKANR